MSPDVLGGPIGGDLASPKEADRENRSARRKKLIVVGVTLAFAALVGLGLILGGLISQKPSQAETAQLALQANRTRLQTPFEDAMQLRDDLFTVERSYLSSMADANGSIARYQKRVVKVQAANRQIDLINAPAMANCRTYSYISCPSPEYESQPAVPDVTGSADKLKSIVGTLNGLHARLLNTDPLPELKVLNAQMLSSIESLTANANQNARVLTQAVISPTGSGYSEGEGADYVDAAQIKTLSGNDALPSIIQMNHAAKGIITLLKLPIRNYDVAGGHDIDPSDHSTGM